MKNLKFSLFALFAIIAGFAMSACTDDPKEQPQGGNEVIAEVTVSKETANGAVLSVTTQNMQEFAYIQRDSELAASAIFVAGTKFTIEEPTKLNTTEVTLQGLEANTPYTLYFAFRKADGVLYDQVIKVDFTTIGYGDNVLTVVDQMYDGFAVHIQIPEEVKERGNALRYSTTSMAMFNYMKSMGTGTYDNLLYNAAQWTTTDKTVICDDYHSVERDEDGDVIYDEEGNIAGASFY
ncbi:MAG: hypothetical protein J6Q21_01805, partial [Alistipes sp.]|nr:hypothetical protein [Alistipes sp.]